MVSSEFYVEGLVRLKYKRTMVKSGLWMDRGSSRVVQRGLGPSQVDNGQCKWTLHESGAPAEDGVCIVENIARVEERGSGVSQLVLSVSSENYVASL